MVKPGLLTSELWLTVLASLNAGTQALTESQRTNLSVLLAAVIYTGCRTFLKTFTARKPPGG